MRHAMWACSVSSIRPVDLFACYACGAAHCFATYLDNAKKPLNRSLNTSTARDDRSIAVLRVTSTRNCLFGFAVPTHEKLLWAVRRLSGLGSLGRRIALATTRRAVPYLVRWLPSLASPCIADTRSDKGIAPFPTSLNRSPSPCGAGGYRSRPIAAKRRRDRRQP